MNTSRPTGLYSMSPHFHIVGRPQIRELYVEMEQSSTLVVFSEKHFNMSELKFLGWSWTQPCCPDLHPWVRVKQSYVTELSSGTKCTGTHADRVNTIDKTSSKHLNKKKHYKNLAFWSVSYYTHDVPQRSAAASDFSEVPSSTSYDDCTHGSQIVLIVNKSAYKRNSVN